MGLITLRTLLLDAVAGSRSEIDDTDAAILRATLTCLARFGTGRMSVADVAAEAGVGRATVFRRFDTKTELVRRAFAWELENLIGDFHSATAGLSDPRDRIEEWFVRAVRVVRTHPVARRIVADGTALTIMSDPQITDLLLDSVEHQLRATIGSSRRLSDLSDEDLRAAAELISRFFVSTWLTPEMGTSTTTDDGVRRIASSMLSFLLAPTPALTMARSR